MDITVNHRNINKTTDTQHQSVMILNNPSEEDIVRIEDLPEYSDTLEYSFNLYSFFWKEAALKGVNVTNDHYGFKTTPKSYIVRGSYNILFKLNDRPCDYASTRTGRCIEIKDHQAFVGKPYDIITGGYGSLIKAGYGSTVQVGDCGVAINRSKANGGNYSVVISDDAQVGDFGIAITLDQYQGVVSAGLGGLIQIRNDLYENQWIIGVVDGERIKPNVKYCAANGELTEIEDGETVSHKRTKTRQEEYTQLVGWAAEFGSWGGSEETIKEGYLSQVML